MTTKKKTAPTPPGDQATTTPDVSQDLGIQFPVTSINGSWEVFNYTDGKLTSGTLSNPDGTFTISHNPLTIKVEMQYGDSGDESSVETYTNIKVNDKGFATSATYQPRTCTMARPKRQTDRPPWHTTRTGISLKNK